VRVLHNFNIKLSRRTSTRRKKIKLLPHFDNNWVSSEGKLFVTDISPEVEMISEQRISDLDDLIDSSFILFAYLKFYCRIHKLCLLYLISGEPPSRRAQSTGNGNRFKATLGLKPS
jgi:hypothetical protein